ncbi:MAG: bi-domain-containing oxidoreductase [Bacteroidetes bacterium]|nr:bi-domain-containing oxidoreductase [Bacteroidota bacterium]
MKQIIQNFKTGDLNIKEVPVPALSRGMVLVENRFSLISSGTEKGTVKVGKANLLNKARQRPDLVAQVLQNIKKEGIKDTFKKVRSKLDTPKALGYSSAGTVIASLDSNNMFKPGDRVACAGQDYASHAEVIAVPQNLVALVPENVSDEEAAFTTLGAIALQGIRQASPKLGEYVCVIGLGLLGQITCQLLRASGCHVYGIDLNDQLVEMAEQHASDGASIRSNPDLIKTCNHFTNNQGFDKVIITASTSSNDPVSLAAELAIKKGLIVVVGVVGMDIPRDPHFYRKELDLKMSCSYGPGRYDPAYEEAGNDYPLAYVRWTEQRNMHAFLQAVSKKQVNLKPLITHRFNIAEAGEAYELILGKRNEFHLGILIKYPERKEKLLEIPENKSSKSVEGPVNVAFIGAGSFAQSYLIPHLKKEDVSLNYIATSKGITAENILTKFGFKKAVSDTETIWNSNEVNTVFIATRHDSHARFVIEGLHAGKNIFVEKPLALNPDELDEITDVMRTNETILVTGFNRRFSHAAVLVQDFYRGLNEPKLMNFRINAGELPPDHWTRQENTGGGRIVGEICHFIDLMQFFSKAEPVRVYAESLPGTGTLKKNDDNISILIRFSDGSVGNIVYASNGSGELPKEYFEIFSGGKTAIIDDFKTVRLFSESTSKSIKTSGKGHKEEIQSFINAIKNGKPSPISFRSIYLTTQATFKIKDSLATGLPQSMDIV